jgi:hypothetical protein
MAEITKQTVFAKIHKLDPRVHGPVADKPYAVMTMDYSATRSYGNKSRWGTDCATLDEARAFVAEKGWVLVKSWKEAKEFTKELRTADSAARQAVEDARKGKRLIRVDNAEGGTFYAYIDAELADALITGYSTIMDENRVVPS